MHTDINTFPGLGLVLVSALCNGTFALPPKFVRNWARENTWGTFLLLTLLVFAAAVMAVLHFATLFAYGSPPVANAMGFLTNEMCGAGHAVGANPLFTEDFNREAVVIGKNRQAHTLLPVKHGRELPGWTKQGDDLPVHWVEQYPGNWALMLVAHHASGNYAGYLGPYPLSEEDFLVSARGLDDKFRIYLMDVHGTMELIYEGVYNAWYPIPVRPRPSPPPQPDRVAWPGTGEARRPPAPGVFYNPDVYWGVPELPRGSVRYLRVVQQDATTFSTWVKTWAFGPPVSAVHTEAVKRIVTVVPVEADGSVHFEAPAGQAFYFQLLDERYRALHTMRSFTHVLPDERRGCVGCHKLHSAAPPPGRGLAMRRGPTELSPPPWGTESISYERFAQPVLDRYCSECHQGEGEAREALDLTLRPAPEPFAGHFREPYLTLLGAAAWPHRLPDAGQAGYGIAAAIPVYGLKPDDVYPADPATDALSTIQRTLRPKRYLSPQSRLVELAGSGEHHGVTVPPADLRRLIAWVDANCPYMGEEEVRTMRDPEFPGIEQLPIRPRMQTAPKIERP